MEIYGTFGPTCYKQETIEEMFRLGMTGMRLNLSHSNLEDHPDWIENFKRAKEVVGVSADLLIDMKGPELRIGKLIEPIVLLKDQMILVSNLAFPTHILDALLPNQTILLDDGRIELEMKENGYALVTRGGTLLSNKSIALPGCTIEQSVLTDSDIENLKLASKYGVTGIMQPFVRSEEDLIFIQEKMDELDISLKVYAKIENMDGLEHLTSFFPYCSQIIIARGDLANAVGLVNIARVQHQIEQQCKLHNMPYMVVTQMLHSMIENPVPTRAEVNDIYSSVYQGASSIMLTQETANGKYPIEAMRTFVEIAETALKDRKK